MVKQKADTGDVIKWLDTLIKADEADVLEILENCLHYLSQEGVATLTQDELLERVRGAIARIQGNTLDSEIEASLETLED